jgi:hypothetical protein
MTRQELENFLIEKVGHNCWQYPKTSMWEIKVLKYLEQRKKKEIEGDGDNR